MKFIRIMYRRLLNIRLSIKNIFLLLFHSEYYDAESYYPEYNDRQNSVLHNFVKQVCYTLKNGRPNEFYYLYGFDIKGFRDEHMFVDNINVFRPARDVLNKCANSPYAILRDKFLFGIVAEGLGICIPRTIALIDNGQIYDDKFVPRDISEMSLIYPILDSFCKLADGECANGVFSLSIRNGDLYVDGNQLDLIEFRNHIQCKRWVIQQRIGQHESVSEIFPNAINTLRLVTLYDKFSHDVIVLSAVLRVGTGDNHVDNWAAGGLSIGIDEQTGRLRKYGFYKPGFGTKVAEHPDTHVVFDGYQIPYFFEAVETAKYFHNFIKGVHSIGWDIAITPTGPCFIEGNDNWEISLMQVCNHGLKKEFDKYF